MSGQQQGSAAPATSAVDHRYEPGDLVRVRVEPLASVVELPTDRACEAPDGVPDLGSLFCVPVALVRTPIGDEPLRWVEVADLTPVDGGELPGFPVPP